MDRCRSLILSLRLKRTEHVYNRRAKEAAAPQAGAGRPKRTAPVHARSGMRSACARRRLGRSRFSTGEITFALAQVGCASGRILSGHETVSSAGILRERLEWVAFAAPALACRTGHFPR